MVLFQATSFMVQAVLVLAVVACVGPVLSEITSELNGML